MRDFTLDVSVIKDCLFKGSVRIKILPYKERLKLLKEMNLQTNDKGEVEGLGNQIDSGIKIYETVEKNIIEMNLSHGKDEIKSLEDLGYYQEGTEIINKLGEVLISGASLGKS